MRKLWLKGTLLATSLVLASYSTFSFSEVTKHAVKSGSSVASKSASNGKAKAKVKKQAVHSGKKELKQHRNTKVHAASVDTGSGPLKLQSSSAMVFDEQSNTPLFVKNSNNPQSIASITKLMTAMVVLDANLQMDEVIAVDYNDVDTLRGSSSRLAVGTALSRGEMLRLALMSSENRAASALARHYPGGTAAFVMAMNRKAFTLGMRHTQFVDSTGLRAENVSTAEDLVKMVTAGYRYETIREYTTTAAHDVGVPGSRHNIEFKNTNVLVRNKEWDIGLSKTGFISEAGRCLVMQVNIASKPMIIVLLDSIGKYTRIEDANRIKRWVENANGRRVAKVMKASRAV